jgi:hypothetical protein
MSAEPCLLGVSKKARELYLFTDSSGQMTTDKKITSRKNYLKITLNPPEMGDGGSVAFDCSNTL